MEQDDGFGCRVRGVAEVVAVAVWAQAADEGGAGRGIHGLPLGSDGDFAVVADTHGGLLAPDKKPPWAGGHRAQDGAFFVQGLLPCGVRGDPQLPVDFVLVGVGQELVEQVVGPFQLDDLIGGQQGRKAFLPVIMAAFDFAFGLRCGRVTQGDAVEVERGSELGIGVGGVGEEEGVVVHGENQRQAVGLEGAGKEVEVGQEGFTFVEAGAGVVAGGVVEEVEQGLFGGVARQPCVWAGVVLPEGPEVAGLPAFDGFGRGLVAGVGGEFVFDGPAADAGTVGFEVEAAVEFAGGGAVGGRGLGGEEFGEQGGDGVGPSRVVIAAGEAGGPALGLALGTGTQVTGAQLVEAADTDAQFGGDCCGRTVAATGLGEEVADQWRGDAVGELEFFMARKMAGRWILRFETAPGTEPGHHPCDGPACRWSGFRRRSGCVPAEPYPPLKL